MTHNHEMTLQLVSSLVNRLSLCLNLAAFTQKNNSCNKCLLTMWPGCYTKTEIKKNVAMAKVRKSGYRHFPFEDSEHVGCQTRSYKLPKKLQESRTSSVLTIDLRVCSNING